MSGKLWRLAGTCLGSLALVLLSLAVDYNSAFYVPKLSLLSSVASNYSREQSTIGTEIGHVWPQLRKEHLQSHGGLQRHNMDVRGRKGTPPPVDGVVDQRHVAADSTGETSSRESRFPGTEEEAYQHGEEEVALATTQEGEESVRTLTHEKENNLNGTLESKSDIMAITELVKLESSSSREEVQVLGEEGAHVVQQQQVGGELAAPAHKKEEKEEEEEVSSSSVEDVENCDVTIGSWKNTSTPPAYTAATCRFIAPERRCEHRVDKSYGHRQYWVPMDCTLPWPLDGTQLLEQLRNKSVLIVGDSVSTGFGEALACALAASTHVDGRVDASHGLQGSHVYYIRSHNITVKQLQIDWLVAWDNSQDAFRRAGIKFEYNRVLLNLDRVDPRWGDQVDESVDILVLSSGSLWNSKIRKTFRNNENVAYLDWSQGYRFALETARSFIEDDKEKICAMDSDVLGPDQTAKVVLAREQCLEIQKELFNPLTGWKTLDISEMSLERTDAHPGVVPLPATTSAGGRKLLRRSKRTHRSKSKAPDQPVADCGGWCLPGVPDHWVSMFHALLAQPSNSALSFST